MVTSRATSHPEATAGTGRTAVAATRRETSDLEVSPAAAWSRRCRACGQRFPARAIARSRRDESLRRSLRRPLHPTANFPDGLIRKNYDGPLEGCRATPEDRRTCVGSLLTRSERCRTYVEHCQTRQRIARPVLNIPGRSVKIPNVGRRAPVTGRNRRSASAMPV